MHLLVDRERKYRKSWIDVRMVGAILGQGLLLSEGDLWAKHRRLLQPLFAQQKFEAYAQIVTDYTTEMLQHWQVRAQSGETFDLGAEITNLTMRVIARTILGVDFAGIDKEVVEAMECAVEYANSRTTATAS
jgi:cytochrome P450